MKAIFSNLGRRVTLDTREATSEPSQQFRSSFTASDPHAPRHQHTYASLDSVGQAIGDAPENSPYRPDTYLPKPLTSHAPPTTALASKLSGSFRATSTRSKRSEPNHSHNAHVAVAPPSSRPSHPPSSYKSPQQQATRTSSTGRGLVRKFSATARRVSSPSSQPFADGAAQTTAQTAALPRLRQLPSAPQLGTARPALESSYHVSPSANLAHSSKPLPSVTSSPHADISTMTSTELAARLNELAVANADGLLTDDEYRTLRHAVFDRMLQVDKQSMAIPIANDLTGHGLLGNVRNADNAATAGASSSHTQPPTELPALNHGASRSSLGHPEPQPSSINSGQSAKSSSFKNVSDLLRKTSTRSKAMQQHASHDSHTSHGLNIHEATSRVTPKRPDSAVVSSRLSSGDSHSQHALSFRTQRSSSLVSTLGRLRTNSQARRTQAASAARDMEEAFSAERTARSLRAVSLYDAGSADIPNLGGSTYDRTHTSLRSGTVPSSMFGAEYVDKSSSEIQAEIAVVQAEGNRMLDMFTTLEQTLLSKHTSLAPLAMSNVIERARDLCPLAGITRLDSYERQALGFRAQRPQPPSSYRMPREDASVSARNKSLQHEQVAEYQDIAAFQADLTSLYTQKAAVVKRYQDRLAFLQSKLRSASVRESLS